MYLTLVSGDALRSCIFPWKKEKERKKIFFQDSLGEKKQKQKPQKRCFGLVRDLNPGPLAPKARIIPLDQRAMDINVSRQY